MPRPAPKSEEAVAKLNELWRSARRYYDEGDWRVRQVAKLGNQLLKSHAASGWHILAGVYALTGDVRSAIESADKALRLSADPAIIIGKATALSNLGYFSEAGRILREALSVDLLPFSKIGEKTIATGTILALDEALKGAGNMQTAVRDPLRKATAIAASILRENNVTDEDIGSWLDVAGQIMRESRFFFIDYPILFVTTEEDFPQVDLSFIVDVDPEQGAELNLALVERCVHAEVIPPECFSFGFRSNPELNERIAA